MDRKKLDSIREDMDAMRRRMVKAADLQALAKQLGRHPVNRGKHPNWESEAFEHLRPLSIPDHGGRDLSKTVRSCALKLLEDDVAAWEAWLVQNEHGNGDGHGN
jgi:hypothetical protein